MPGKKFYHQRFGKKIGSCIFWGTVDLCIGQHLGRLLMDILAAMSADTQSTLDQYDGDTRLLQSIGQQLANTLPTDTLVDMLVEMQVDMSVDELVEWQSSISRLLVSRGCVLADMGLVYLVTTFYRSIVGWQLESAGSLQTDHPRSTIENTGLPVIKCFENLDRQSS